MVLNVRHKKILVGGQAVIEGVMMRAPKRLAIAVRRPGGEIIIKEDRWRSLSEKWPFLRWPLIRGSVVIVEALVNGVQALTFSANQALEEDGQSLGDRALALTIALGIGAGLLLFVVVPHVITGLVGRVLGVSLDVKDSCFHLIDGGAKLIIFLGYIWLISFFKDIRRIFEYHGAEHKSVYTFEAGEALTVENARRYSTLHPRCGTAFIVVVLLTSILFFSMVFPFWWPSGSLPGFMRQILAMLMKILLIFPIAGLAYEIIRFSSKNMEHGLVRLAVLPGLWVQKLTTREPGDDQLEVALAALKRALEEQGQTVKRPQGSY